MENQYSNQFGALNHHVFDQIIFVQLLNPIWSLLTIKLTLNWQIILFFQKDPARHSLNLFIQTFTQHWKILLKKFQKEVQDTVQTYENVYFYMKKLSLAAHWFRIL